MFPWYNPGEPILWWSPDPRCVLLPDQVHISRSLAKVVRQGRFEVTFDCDFVAVIDACQAIRSDEGTWITPEMRRAYVDLHRLGYAHSVECWQQGRLVGGLYGISLGRCFFGESMFSRVSDASKVAIVTLCQRLATLGFRMLDCQQTSAHLLSLGASEISRSDFCAQLSQGLLDSEGGLRSDFPQ
ncbi:MAG: leucyl/phenylalanyl-tRNA--protein transferase [Geopsychrobacter sp.]|nr:leucyl/phenylalanyl-tRNA--protein transferase [Geopsychrobacter sp.]